MKTGISLYVSSGIEKNSRIIKKAEEHGAEYVFTSLHIPEETGVNYQEEIKTLLSLCREIKCKVIVDVGPETYKKLGVTKMEELKDLGITHLRLDYGFTAKEVVEIAQSFSVVFNASTITEEELVLWKEYGADFTKFAACHNFYPKEYTGLSLQRVKEINLRLKYLGFVTMAFVPGNLELRGPLSEGLPTVEEHRGRRDDVVLNMLELFQEGCCDVVLIGDVDIKDRDWEGLRCLNQGYVELRADLLPDYEFIKGTIHHDRPDSSDYIFRSQESRQYEQEIKPQPRHHIFMRKAGNICISNKDYLRYMGELEIARKDLPTDPRLNVVGQIDETDIKYLPYIQKGFGLKLL